MSKEASRDGKAYFGVGILPGGGMPARLPQVVGSAVARTLEHFRRYADEIPVLGVGRRRAACASRRYHRLRVLKKSAGEN
jgi:hypothetical protein